MQRACTSSSTACDAGMQPSATPHEPSATPHEPSAAKALPAAPAAAPQQSETRRLSTQHHRPPADALWAQAVQASNMQLLLQPQHSCRASRRRPKKCLQPPPCKHMQQQMRRPSTGHICWCGRLHILLVHACPLVQLRLLQVGRVESAEVVQDSEKLLCCQLDLGAAGGKRQVPSVRGLVWLRCTKA